MSLIFISYSDTYKAYVDNLRHALVDKGFDVWTEDRIDYGSIRLQEIEKRLRECSAFILVMSPNWERSDPAQNQLRIVDELKKPIFPLLLEGKAWSQLDAIQFVDVRTGELPPGKFFTNLIRAVERYETQAEPIPGPAYINIRGNASGSPIILGNRNEVKIDTINLVKTSKLDHLEDNLKKSPLKSRVDVIRQKVGGYWQQVLPLQHFTYQGIMLTQAAENILEEVLAFLLPGNELSDEENFILLAACWLYEIGLRPPVYSADKYGLPRDVDFSVLERIHREKHLLSNQIILDSLEANYSGPGLGLQGIDDEYVFLVAKVCRWCSPETIEAIPKKDEFINLRNLRKIRIKLLVCILRLVDQLHIGKDRINWDYAKGAFIPLPVKAKIWASQFAYMIPFEENTIKFCYSIPDNLAQLLPINTFRNLVESDFEYQANPVLQYLAKHGLHLTPPTQKDYTENRIRSRNLNEIDHEIIKYLETGV